MRSKKSGGFITRRNCRKLAICVLFLSAVFAGVVRNVPTFAESGEIDTTFFGSFKDGGEGCGVYMVLNFVIDVLTFGVGIAAAIGIAVSGITYMTARGSEVQVTKAKRRVYEIVIGLATYAVFWALLNFLLPGGLLNNSPTCTPIDHTASPYGTSTTTEYKKTTKRPWPGTNGGLGKLSSDSSGSSSSIMAAAKYVAQVLENNKYTYGSNNTVHSISKLVKTKRGHSDCATYVSLVLQKAGILKNGQTFNLNHGAISNPKLIKNNKKLQVFYPHKSVRYLVSHGKLAPGDVVGLANQAHTMIYRGKINGKYWFINGGKNGTKNGSNGSQFVASKILKDGYGCTSGKCTLATVIHIKK